MGESVFETCWSKGQPVLVDVEGPEYGLAYEHEEIIWFATEADRVAFYWARQAEKGLN